ncbi:uncharacterized protein LOC133795193 [Humulus lupulus]|uniref:uncharacterized protein LOC133795193 n=1 Tax=Humulus lupulus TaxID=3486 RepID=UPI002B402D13|nr:uncharacterized protein LOC133795193 [Humulus lupulus]
MLIGVRVFTTRVDNSQIDEFWEKFMHILSRSDCVGAETISQPGLYQESVFNMLHEHKNQEFSEDMLMKLQLKIEDNNEFSEMNLRYLSPDIVQILIKKDKPTAREYLKSTGFLTEEEQLLINKFHHYTLEAIIVHVLSTFYDCQNDLPAIRTATLIEQIDIHVRYMASIFGVNTMMVPSDQSVVKSIKNEAEDQIKAKRKSKVSNFSFGVLLLEFLVDREIITIDSTINYENNDVINKHGKRYKRMNSFAICNFNMGILPVKLNLPMVCKPKQWCPVNNTIKKDLSITDLQGGYLSKPISEIYNTKLYKTLPRYKLFSSRDIEHFSIKLNEDYLSLCDIMNALQDQAFTINKDQFLFIHRHYDLFIKHKLSPSTGSPTRS